MKCPCCDGCGKTIVGSPCVPYQDWKFHFDKLDAFGKQIQMFFGVPLPETCETCGGTGEWLSPKEMAEAASQ